MEHWDNCRVCNCQLRFIDSGFSSLSFRPIIGGILSEPALRWPLLFGRISLFVQHPYFLPCAVAALLAFVSVPIGLVGLREVMFHSRTYSEVLLTWIYKTSPTVILRKKQKKADATRSLPNESTALTTKEVGAVTYGSTAVAECENSAEAGTALAIIPSVQSPSQRSSAPQILLVYGFITFTDMCVLVLQPLVWSTSISLGGLGFNPYRIGLIMGIWGFINAIIQSTCLGPIIRRIGPRNMLAAAFTSWITVLALYPLLSFFTRNAGGADARVWTILIMQLALLTTTSGAYGTYSPVSVHTFFDE